MNAKSLISAGMLVVVGMVGGRLLGMLREVMMAANFGIGQEGDTAILLMILPDFITGALIGTAASAALVPAFAARSPERALALFWQALGVSVLVFSLCIALLTWQWPWVMGRAGDSATLHTTATVTPFFIVLWSIPFSVATAVVTAYLQHRGRFLVPAFATVLFNSAIIAALWLKVESLLMLAAAIFVASLVRFFPHMLAFWRACPAPRQVCAAWELDKKLLKIYALATGSGVLGLLPIYAPYALVVAAGSSIASFNYAFKLILLPGVLTQTVVQLVVLPWLVARRAADTIEKQQAHTAHVLQLAWLIALSMSLTLSMAAHPIADLFFSYGKMTAEDVARIGSLFAIGVWALPGMLLTTVWQVIFYAQERPTPPLIANGLQALLILPLCSIGHAQMGLEGVVIAFALTQAIATLALAIMAAQYIPGRAYFTMTFATLLVFIPLLGLFEALHLHPFAALCVAILVGMVLLISGALATPTLRHVLNEEMKRRRHENDTDHQRP